MKNMPVSPEIESILNHSISGFHQYALTPQPARLLFVSQNLCDMTGFSREELLSGEADFYLSLVHPADRKDYLGFLNRLSLGEQRLTAEYRLVRKDGGILYVSDSAASRQREDGSLVGNSVLTDITPLKKENDSLRFLNETIPCGFIRYTCEKQPKITYMNRQMRAILGLCDAGAEDGSPDDLEFYKDNIFLMFPVEERRRFALYLNRIYSQNSPMAGEITVLRCDGTKAYLFGWVTKCVGDRGTEEFQSVCMDITRRRQEQKAKESRRYIKALSDVYDRIFEYDLSNHTVRYLHGQNTPAFPWMKNIPMQLEEATEACIQDMVAEKDQEQVRAFFDAFLHRKEDTPGLRPSQIRYQARSFDGSIRTYTGIFLKIEDSVSLFCSRRMPDTRETDSLRTENRSLKENLKELVTRFTDGIAAFEVTNDLVTPLYASDNVCGFFGFNKKEWLQMMKKGTPLKYFVERSRASFEEFQALLQNGEAEFTYFDLSTGTQRQIKAICSPKSAAGTSPRYVMLYNVDRKQPEEPKPGRNSALASIRAFGYFDVFVGGRPIPFRNKKAKELLALLVDRRGGYVSSEEAISFLWEDEPVTPVTLARYRKVALRLKNTLAEYGIPGIVEAVDGKRRIVTELVRCDLYDYLSGDEKYAQLFKGCYLTNYSWGENTLAELSGGLLYP